VVVMPYPPQGVGVVGIRKLSELIIDVDKSWEGYRIKNLGAPIDSTDASRLAEITSHRTAIPADHPDGSVTTAKIADLAVTTGKIADRAVTRTKLEYPTVDVSFTYLHSIDKTRWHGPGAVQHFWHFGTVDSFTDRSVWLPLPNMFHALLRFIDGNNMYTTTLYSDGTTEDFVINKRVGGTTTFLATEAVDIGTYDVYQVVGSISGSVLKGYRDVSYTTNPTLRISATDTTFASGVFGYTKRRDWAGSGIHEGFAQLRSSMSPGLQALAIIEVETTGNGSADDPFGPKMKSELVEISNGLNVPDFLKIERKKYDVLKSKGFTDKEIKLLFGYVPRHQIDTATVSFGSFEFSSESATNIITVSGNNPYDSRAIEKQIEHARSRNLKVISPPKDYGEAVEQFRMLKKDFPHWLAGKDNYAYQTLGHEVFEIFQNVDFYYGELLEHKKHYDQIKQVPDFEISRRLDELESKLLKIDVLIDERDKHHDKLREMVRKGW